jgi:hypothetical protein
LLIDTVVCLTLAKWETVSGRFGGYLTYQGGSLIALPRVSFGSSTGEARIVGRDLEQPAARRSEIDRAEAAAIDLLGRVQPLRRERADQFGLRASSANASWRTQPVP